MAHSITDWRDGQHWVTIHGEGGATVTLTLDEFWELRATRYVVAEEISKLAQAERGEPEVPPAGMRPGQARPN